MTINYMEYTHRDIPEASRKYHYYRGMKATLIIISPFIAVLMIAVYVMASALAN